MKILQADDHELFRDGIRYLLKRLDENVDTVASGDFSDTATAINDNPDLDLVLLDLDMPGMNGLDGLKRIVQTYPSLPIVVLSASDNPGDIDYALEIGAAGFVPKSSPADIMLSALKLVLAGGIYAPRINRSKAPKSCERNSLTERQIQILNGIAQGLSNKGIAEKLFLSESTVKGHIRIILQILHVENRVQAINKARQLGVITP